MNDRELLEWAAKAPGVQDLIDGEWERKRRTWNPLDNDGQALRLVVKFNLTVSIFHHEVEVFTEEGECISIAIGDDEDKAAIVRRAIVRAVAQIGKSMEAK